MVSKVGENPILLLIILLFYKAWDEFPTISKTLVHPVTMAEFPTITICKKDNNPDRWGPAIKILNHLDRICRNQR